MSTLAHLTRPHWGRIPTVALASVTATTITISTMVPHFLRWHSRQGLTLWAPIATSPLMDPQTLPFHFQNSQTQTISLRLWLEIALSHFRILLCSLMNYLRDTMSMAILRPGLGIPPVHAPNFLIIINLCCWRQIFIMNCRPPPRQ